MIQLAIKLSLFTILLLSAILGNLLWNKYSIKDITLYKERASFKSSQTVLPEKQKKLLGSWVEPSLENKKEFQGFTLYADGTAKSINTGDLTYKTWKMYGNEILLRVETYDNGSVSEDIESYIVEKVSHNVLLLKIGQSVFKYKKILS